MRKKFKCAVIDEGDWSEIKMEIIV